MATKVQKKLLVLLKEFDEICKGTGIAWSLNGKTACDAIRNQGFSGSTYEAHATIPEESVARLQQAIEASGTPNRIIVTNKAPRPLHKGNVNLFYSATDTALLDFRRSYSTITPHLSVTVQPALKRDDGPGYAIPMKDGRVVKLSESFFESIETVKLDGYSLPLSTEFAEAFKRIVDVTTKDPWPYRTYVSGIIETYASASVSYDDFLANLEQVGCRDYLESVHDHYITRLQWMKEELNPIQQLVEQDNTAMEITELRYKFWLKYYPFKGMLVKKWLTGYNKAVAYALGSYVNALIDFFERTGMAIYFDRELFCLALFVLKGMGYDRIAELRKAVPAQHRKPLINDKKLVKKLCESARQGSKL